MQREGAHEVGQDVVAFLARQVLGQHHAAFDGGAAVARIADGGSHRAHAGLGECRFRLAVAEGAVGHHVAADRLVQGDAAGVQRLLDGDDRGQRLVLHADAFERVLGQVPVFGDHHRHGFAHVAHPVDGECPVLHRLLDAHHERLGPLLNVGAGQHRPHARQPERRAGIDGQQAGMGMGRTQDRGLQGAGPGAQVVGVAAATAQQRIVFQALDALADEAGGGPGELGLCVHCCLLRGVSAGGSEER